MSNCPNCGSELTWVQAYSKWFCQRCQQYPYAEQSVGVGQSYQASVGAGSSGYSTSYDTRGSAFAYDPQRGSGSGYAGKDPIWFQNQYRVRKKVLTLWNEYWIEDYGERVLGFTRQKMFKLKEDIRIYTDENMTTELFRIQQTQIVDVWGTFAVIDTRSNANLGYIKRKGMMSTFAWDEWDVLGTNGQPIGGIHEHAGRGLVRKFVPFGALVPEKMTLKLNNYPVAEINQEFKIIGDIWNLYCISVPEWFDRRVLLGGLILMAMIERKHK